MAADSDYETVPVIHDVYIPDYSSQKFWDEWFPLWGKIKKASDDIRASLLTDDRPDKINPYYGLINLSAKMMEELVTTRVFRGCNQLIRARDRWIDMDQGIIFPVNARGCHNRDTFSNSTFGSLSVRKDVEFLDLLKQVPEDISKHICYAGGAVKNLIAKLNNSKKTDHDLFIVGHCDPRSITRKFLTFLAEKEDCIINNISRTKRSLSTNLRYKNVVFKIQIILRHYLSPCELVYGFDIDAAACLYHREKFYMTPGAQYSLENMEICIDVDRLSTTAISRYVKYWYSNGFCLRLPMPWPECYLDPFLTAHRKETPAQRKANDENEALYQRNANYLKQDIYQRKANNVMFWPVNDQSLCSLFFRARSVALSGSFGCRSDSDYDANTQETKDFFEARKKFNNRKRDCADNYIIYVPGPSLYFVSAKKQSDIVDNILSMPKCMFELAKKLDIPTETEFVSVNPGSQGEIGVIQKDGRNMITGSFQPISKSWSEWAQLPKMKCITVTDSNKTHLFGINPNFGYSYRSSTWYPTYSQDTVDKVMNLINEAGGKSREEITKLIRTDPKFTHNYKNRVNELLSSIIVPELDIGRFHYLTNTIDSKEELILGQTHFINSIGIGTIISIDSNGVLLFLNKCYNDYNSCYVIKRHYLHISYHNSDKNDDVISDEEGPEHEITV